MIDPRDIKEAINHRMNRILPVAECSLPPNQFQAYRQFVLDKSGRTGLAHDIRAEDRPVGNECIHLWAEMHQRRQYIRHEKNIVAQALNVDPTKRQTLGELKLQLRYALEDRNIFDSTNELNELYSRLDDRPKPKKASKRRMSGLD